MYDFEISHAKIFTHICCAIVLHVIINNRICYEQYSWLIFLYKWCCERVQLCRNPTHCDVFFVSNIEPAFPSLPLPLPPIPPSPSLSFLFLSQNPFPIGLNNGKDFPRQILLDIFSRIQEVGDGREGGMGESGISEGVCLCWLSSLKKCIERLYHLCSDQNECFILLCRHSLWQRGTTPKRWWKYSSSWKAQILG